MTEMMSSFTPAVLPAGTVDLDGKIYMRDATGGLRPRELVKASDQLIDETVRRIMGFAVALSDQVSRFKAHTFDDIGALTALLDQEYGVKLRLQNMEAVLARKLQDLPEAARTAALRDIATSWRVQRIMDGAPGRAPVGMLSTDMAAAAGIPDPMIWVTRATFEHLVLDHLGDPKDAAFRKALMSLVANVGQAVLAAMEDRADGTRTLRILIPFDRYFHVTESARPEKSQRPTALVLWFDEGMRVRTITPTTEKRFRDDATRKGNRVISLEGT